MLAFQSERRPVVASCSLLHAVNPLVGSQSLLNGTSPFVSTLGEVQSVMKLGVQRQMDLV